ncbi:hypothetical protein [Streptomyces sp. NRRL S-1448]|uniref:hypothetical protein n=1 Tax=Streptomyces sp. NRRL S-1448 TaxID=1463883 RepID=UPI000569EF5F|nr:hypothetical protein [Streptomyces sp. NRRL S-1448]
MDPLASVEKIARTCLYEGYLLWPYRRSALKNTKRWTFGGVYPKGEAEALGEPARMRTETLLETAPGTSVTIRLRFLQVVERQVYRRDDGEHRPVDTLTVAGETHLTWHEAAEREWVLPTWSPSHGRTLDVVDLPDGAHEEPLRDEHGRAVGMLVRRWKRLHGTVEVDAQPGPGSGPQDTVRLAVTFTNTTPCPPHTGDPREGRDKLAPYAFVSTHTVLTAHDGSFVSLADPPAELVEAAGGCRNEGTWPVLIGDGSEADRDPHRSPTVLSSPVTLSDFPAVAPESPGDLFDGGEIDHLLILNVLSLTPAEQREARATDPRAREILDRCAALSPEDLLALRGTIRSRRTIKEDA